MEKGAGHTHQDIRRRQHHRLVHAPGGVRPHQHPLALHRLDNLVDDDVSDLRSNDSPDGDAPRPRRREAQQKHGDGDARKRRHHHARHVDAQQVAVDHELVVRRDVVVVAPEAVARGDEVKGQRHRLARHGHGDEVVGRRHGEARPHARPCSEGPDDDGDGVEGEDDGEVDGGYVVVGREGRVGRGHGGGWRGSGTGRGVIFALQRSRPLRTPVSSAR